ncbi:Hypothetical predicted protein [Xyrichtys novacula]|uniref:Uncharacterized protein n=1 Tax=Xyrichtys novacula TaxID=13765 RepID=A0AAV1ETE6_XYRNO|nr:Hypothetical predicted protein [Xyrichtys novacula]
MCAAVGSVATADGSACTVAGLIVDEASVLVNNVSVGQTQSESTEATLGFFDSNDTEASHTEADLLTRSH